jgi:cell division septation protein DedD
MDVIAEYPDENTSKIGLGPTGGGGTVPQTATTSSNTRRGQSAPTVVYNNAQPANNQETTSSLSLPNIKAGQAPGVVTQPANRVATVTPSSSAGANQRVMRSTPAAPVNTKGAGLFKFVAYKTQADGFGVQIGVYGDYRTVLEQTNQLMLADIQDILIYAHNDGNKDLFKMIIGPFASRGAAEQYKKQLTTIGKEGFIIALKDLN